jgi:hypothetical protein
VTARHAPAEEPSSRADEEQRTSTSRSVKGRARSRPRLSAVRDNGGPPGPPDGQRDRLAHPYRLLPGQGLARRVQEKGAEAEEDGSSVELLARGDYQPVRRIERRPVPTELDGKVPAGSRDWTYEWERRGADGTVEPLAFEFSDLVAPVSRDSRWPREIGPETIAATGKGRMQHVAKALELLPADAGAERVVRYTATGLLRPAPGAPPVFLHPGEAGAITAAGTDPSRRVDLGTGMEAVQGRYGVHAPRDDDGQAEDVRALLDVARIAPGNPALAWTLLAGLGACYLGRLFPLAPVFVYGHSGGGKTTAAQTITLGAAGAVSGRDRRPTVNMREKARLRMGPELILHALNGMPALLDDLLREREATPEAQRRALEFLSALGSDASTGTAAARTNWREQRVYEPRAPRAWPIVTAEANPMDESTMARFVVIRHDDRLALDWPALDDYQAVETAAMVSRGWAAVIRAVLARFDAVTAWLARERDAAMDRYTGGHIAMGSLYGPFELAGRLLLDVGRLLGAIDAGERRERGAELAGALHDAADWQQREMGAGPGGSAGMRTDRARVVLATLATLAREREVCYPGLKRRATDDGGVLVEAPAEDCRVRPDEAGFAAGREYWEQGRAQVAGFLHDGELRVRTADWPWLYALARRRAEREGVALPLEAGIVQEELERRELLAHKAAAIRSKSDPGGPKTPRCLVFQVAEVWPEAGVEAGPPEPPEPEPPGPGSEPPEPSEPEPEPEPGPPTLEEQEREQAGCAGCEREQAGGWRCPDHGEARGVEEWQARYVRPAVEPEPMPAREPEPEPEPESVQVDEDQADDDGHRRVPAALDAAGLHLPGGRVVPVPDSSSAAAIVRTAAEAGARDVWVHAGTVEALGLRPARLRADAEPSPFLEPSGDVAPVQDRLTEMIVCRRAGERAVTRLHLVSGEPGARLGSLVAARDGAELLSLVRRLEALLGHRWDGSASQTAAHLRRALARGSRGMSPGGYNPAELLPAPLARGVQRAPSWYRPIDAAEAERFPYVVLVDQRANYLAVLDSELGAKAPEHRGGRPLGELGRAGWALVRAGAWADPTVFDPLGELRRQADDDGAFWADLHSLRYAAKLGIPIDVLDSWTFAESRRFLGPLKTRLRDALYALQAAGGTEEEALRPLVKDMYSEFVGWLKSGYHQPGDVLWRPCWADAILGNAAVVTHRKAMRASGRIVAVRTDALGVLCSADDAAEAVGLLGGKLGARLGDWKAEGAWPSRLHVLDEEPEDAQAATVEIRWRVREHAKGGE